MARGSKAKQSQKQIRKAYHNNEEGHKKRGVLVKQLERRAWVTINKMLGGKSQGGSGSEKIQNPSPAKKGERKQALRPTSQRSASVTKAAQRSRKKQSM